METVVKTLEELLHAVTVAGAKIKLQAAIQVPHPLRLAAGVEIVGVSKKLGVLSFPYSDGIALSQDNKVIGLVIQTASNQRAFYIESREDDLGKISLKYLRVSGQVQILTHAPHQTLQLIMKEVDIAQADTRMQMECPVQQGRMISQGALTIYNTNEDPNSLITAELEGITIGRYEVPVIGSGILLSGSGGKIAVSSLSTAEVYTNGMLPLCADNLSTAGLFIGEGVHVKKVSSHGEVTTYGAYDNVFEVWGEVDQWIAEGPLTTHGMQAAGFENYNKVHDFHAKETIETFGVAAIGFRQGAGRVGKAHFKSFQTHSKGSVAVEIASSVKELVVDGIISVSDSDYALIVEEKGSIEQLKLGEKIDRGKIFLNTERVPEAIKNIGGHE